MSIGIGKTIVEFFSAEIAVSVWRYLEYEFNRDNQIREFYLNWRAAGELAIVSAASFKFLEAFISPSAAMI